MRAPSTPETGPSLSKLVCTAVCTTRLHRALHIHFPPTPETNTSPAPAPPYLSPCTSPPPSPTGSTRKAGPSTPTSSKCWPAPTNPPPLLIAPTGGGKTLAELPPHPRRTRHPTVPRPPHPLYLPLKALTADIRRNLRTPVEGAALPIRIEDRTGDTSTTQRRRQRADPPHILLTTPESLALLLSYEDAPKIFQSLQRVVIDELHALAESKRGDQLMLLLSRLETLAPNLRRVGLSATVEDPPALARYLSPTTCDILRADPGPDPDIAMLETETPPPWSGGGGRYAMRAILDEVRRHRTTLIFHNTRAQAELFFHDLWLQNDEGLPIGIHHGSLAREQRERVEAAMTEGRLRAVVCTGSLDPIDWATWTSSFRSAHQRTSNASCRIGRANHRYNALQGPDFARKPLRSGGMPRRPRRCPRPRSTATAASGRDVLCQHILLTAASGPFDANKLFTEVKRTGPYTTLTPPRIRRLPRLLRHRRLRPPRL
ncbi:MAG: DEAD/DEAH box helicase [Paracoccaceae bacterium]